MAAALSPQYGPRLLPIATCAVPAAFSSKRTWPRGRSAGLSPIPSSAITSAPSPASSTRRLRRIRRLAAVDRPRPAVLEAKHDRLGQQLLLSAPTESSDRRRAHRRRRPRAARCRSPRPGSWRRRRPRAAGRRSSHGRPSTRSDEIRPRRTANPELACTLDRRQELARLRIRCPASAATALRAASRGRCRTSSARARRATSRASSIARRAGCSSTYEYRRRPIDTSAHAALSRRSGVGSSTWTLRREAPRPGLGPGRATCRGELLTLGRETARRRRPAAARPGARRPPRGRSDTSRTRALRS